MSKQNPKLNSISVILFGPILGLLYVVFLPLIFLSAALMSLPGIVQAKSDSASLPGKSEICITCHSQKGMYKKFASNERMSVFVDTKQFKSSVHSSIGCDGCHPNMLGNHPGRDFKSREEFIAAASKACRTCHPDEKLKAKNMHYYVVSQAKAPPCVECHSAHNVKYVAAWKKTTNDTQYCLTCHKKDLVLSINGQKISLTVDEQKMKGSVHNNHQCFDCHTEFSKEKHPVRSFADMRDHSLVVSQACKRCHFEKFKLMTGSIHSSMLKAGNTKSPVCTDCHGFHNVTPKASYDTLAGVPCKKCHSQIFKLYTESVHGKAKVVKHHKAPLCSSCHRAHDVQATAMNERIKDACLSCHNNAVDKHSKWLPNAALHIDNISCAACHSPNAERRINLRLVNSSTGKPFNEDELIKMLGPDYQKLIGKTDPHGEGLAPEQMWAAVSKLNKRGVEAKVTFFGKMDVSKGSEAHSLDFKHKAVKQCEQCHNANSAFFNNVQVAIIKADGRQVNIKANKNVLASMFSVVPVNQFYVLGSTRLLLLDIMGALFIVGGASVALIHSVVMRATAPIRRRKKEGHK